MAKGEKLEGKFQEEQDHKPLTEFSSSDDDTEDLTFTITEITLLMRAANLDQNDNDGVVLDDDNTSKNGNGVGVVCGGDGSDNCEAETVVKDSNSFNERKKRKKIEKTETGGQSAVTAKQEQKAETIEKLETLKNAEAVHTTVELDEIPDNIVLRKLLRGPRYFDPPDTVWSTCHKCHKEGHTSQKCPSVRKKKPCFLCGSLEHGGKQCSKERVCVICKSKGHSLKDCPEKHQGCRSNVCLKCGYSGHDLFSCNKKYSLDDLKEIQCYVCKSFGHLCCVKFVDNSPREVSCYNCGELGHTGLECSSLHGKAATAASPSLG